MAAKSEEQQARAVVFRELDLKVRQRTQVINALRIHLAEYGLVVAKGPSHVAMLVELVQAPETRLSATARLALDRLIAILRMVSEQIKQLD